MKKIIMISVMMLFVLLGMACSSDDNDAVEIKTKELFIKADKNQVSKGERVVFSAFDIDNKAVAGVEYYLNNNKIESNYSFNNKGIYHVVAKKEGYNTSVPIPIIVSDVEGDLLKNKLVIIADKTSVFIGDEVKFTVKADGKVLTDAKIQIEEVGVMTSTSWIVNATGIYRVMAIKDGFVSSEAIEIEVNAKSTVTDQAFTIKGVKYDIKSVVLGVDIDKNKKPVLYTNSNGESYYVFKLFADHSRETFAMYTMEVRVPKGTEKLVYPYETEASNVRVIGGLGIIDNKIAVSIGENEIGKASVKWDSPLVNNKGKVEYEFYAADYKLEIKYNGEYGGLAGVEVSSASSTLKEGNREIKRSYKELR